MTGLEGLPKIYDYPPLYTKQLNAIIFSKQLGSWCDIILQYSRENKIFKMSDSHLKVLFDNKKIQRSVSPTLQKKIWEYMFENRHILYLKEDPSTSASSMRKIIVDKKQGNALLDHQRENVRQTQQSDVDAMLENGIVLWRSVEEWGSLLLNYMVSNSNGNNSIFTLYELQKQALNQAFLEIDWLLLKYIMQEELGNNRKRVVMMYEEDPSEDQFGELVGVKLV